MSRSDRVVCFELHRGQQLAADLIDRIFGGLLAEQRPDHQGSSFLLCDGFLQRLRQNALRRARPRHPLGGWPMTRS